MHCHSSSEAGRAGVALDAGTKREGVDEKDIEKGNVELVVVVVQIPG